MVDVDGTVAQEMRVSPEYGVTEHAEPIIEDTSGDDEMDDPMLENLGKAGDKYEAAMAMQPEALQRRVSSRIPVPRFRVLDGSSSVTDPVPRRPVRDRWFYDTGPPAVLVSKVLSHATNGGAESVVGGLPDFALNQALDQVPDDTAFVSGDDEIFLADRPSVPLTRLQRRSLLKRFTSEGRIRRRAYRRSLRWDWEVNVAPAYDQKNDRPDGEPLGDEEIAFVDFMSQRLDRFDQDFDAKKVDFMDDLSYASLPSSYRLEDDSKAVSSDTLADALLQQRTADLWAGLRRVYLLW
jgi:hypothetical protein